MKKVIFACLALIGAVSFTAQAQKSDTAKGAKPMRAQLSKVAPADVPAGVTASLKSPDYAGWTLGDVYTTPDKTKYMVTATKGAEKQKLWFDAEGKLIPSKKKSS